MGTIRLFVAKRRLSEEALSKLRQSELILNYIEDAVGHLIVLFPHIGIPAADWNVQSTRAQFALGKVLTALERAEPWQEPAEQAETSCSRKRAEILTKAKKEAGTVTALAAALCSRDMAPEARCRTESTIASEVRQLIGELGRVRALLCRWDGYPAHFHQPCDIVEANSAQAEHLYSHQTGRRGSTDWPLDRPALPSAAPHRVP